LKTLEGRASAVCGGLSPSAVPSSTFSAYACHPRGVLPAHWTCRVFSGLWGIVVIRASWPGHPTLIKKKKRILKRKRIQTHQYSVVTFWALVITWPDVCMIRSWAMIRYSQASLDLFKGLKTNNHIYIYIYIYKNILILASRV